MENLDDSENNAKVSDSAYSTSCSNSQSRRSRSSKSTHSGSNSSGSSGYGGKQSTSGSSNNLIQPPEKRTKDKDGKKKKQVKAEISLIQADVEFRLPEPARVCEIKKEVQDEVATSSAETQDEKGIQDMDTTTETNACEVTTVVQTPQVSMDEDTNKPSSTDGFSCVISMHDGVVMYTTSSLTSTLGFPKEMWIGRTFIDFIHPLDHNTFASQITSGLAVPKKVNDSISTTCRIRRYRGLASGFGIKDRTVSFMPFMLKLSFKNINDENGLVIYLVIQATPLFSAFKTPHEAVVNAVPFVMRHISNGNLEYIDHESVTYLGYFPQDIIGKNILQLYHPEDLAYMRQVYETIVKEGGSPRSKPYRFMAQNGHYLKLETEWSSFINPWSRKLEFVIAKHHVIEGPAHPDVFQSPVPEKRSEEDKSKAQALRDNIVRIMNEVLTKPAEFAKQQMTERCQDLASFMESLMEDQPKPEDDLRLEIQDQDNSYYERDSVMLGGISPHHEYNDSKSSISTPLSYNQLNFNDNLQRYFDRQFACKEYQGNIDRNAVTMKDQGEFSGGCMSPMAQQSGDSAELTSSGESSGAALGESSTTQLARLQPFRLTEALLNKHNSEMEKTLVKKQRDYRPYSKQDRDKATVDTKQKKKDHLARCNASFLPTTSSHGMVISQPHGIKRASKQFEVEEGAHKLHCGTPRQIRKRHPASCNSPLPSATATTSPQWRPNPMNGMNPFMPRLSMSQQVPLMSPVAAVPGLIPMYYVPTAGPTIPLSAEPPIADPCKSAGHFQAPPVQYMMYGQAVFGSPFMVSPIGTQVPYGMQQNLMSSYDTTPNTLGLNTSNFEEVCKPGIPLTPGQSHATLWRDKKRNSESGAASSKAEQGSRLTGSIRCISNALNRSTEEVPGLSVSHDSQMKGSGNGNSEETVDRTDGESSYSSFYSSFFKTESGSADDSGDAKKGAKNINSSFAAAGKETARDKILRRKMEPPWMEQVCVTSELIYKYQVMTKSIDEVLTSDKQKLATVEQPALVNEQLGQLYLDLQLENVAARLTLEEGITSSGSSGDEHSIKLSEGYLAKRAKRKRDYSKLVMIYEEDAPLPSPSPSESGDPQPSISLT